jgi:tRNA A37 threonylcarbamoyladenosine dehydratase
LTVIVNATLDEADLERRFGGLRRLYGDDGYGRIRSARIAVVGLGGVGSWTVEALARSGVAELVLFDLDHVAESNINRQVQAMGRTLGQAKAQALAERIADIHPGCRVTAVEAFVQPDNWPALLPAPVDVLVDACDQSKAKATLAAWALHARVPLVCVGAAGGKRRAEMVAVDDLADVTHDPLLAGLRQRLRKDGVAPRQGRMGVRCVFSREPVSRPQQEGCDLSKAGSALACAGYGSSVTVTATFGLVAAGEALAQRLAAAGALPA